MKRETLYYLASPYSHKDEAVMRKRVERLAEYMVVVLGLGYRVFSPILHSSSIKKMIGDEYDWLPLDLVILERCDALVVLQMEGWSESAGVAKEIAFAEERGIRVLYRRESNHAL